MDMSKISKCSVNMCAYNKDQQCHALAITVGDQDDPQCDTFLPSGSKGGDMGTTGKVGACKVSVCRFNESLECIGRADRGRHEAEHGLLPDVRVIGTTRCAGAPAALQALAGAACQIRDSRS